MHDRAQRRGNADIILEAALTHREGRAADPRHARANADLARVMGFAGEVRIGTGVAMRTSPG